ncbi:MAG TPA: ArsA family ATPase [Dehalococcoidia bacterium]|jgi:arsenite-transporting ATPase|nr:ArsA family ATPase [Dehalococcoidia bacterium]
MNDVLSRKFIFFAGKGGSGKTTCAAAFSLCLAQSQQPTLVVSTDPAHSLSDIFGTKIGSKETKIIDNLWGIEIDPEREAKRYTETIKEKMRNVVSSVIVDEIKRQIDIAYLSPGAEESAIFDKFIELMEKIDRPYEKIVFDTAPTGHTLRLLTLPEILGAWIERLIKKREQAMSLMRMASADRESETRARSDPVIQTLEQRKAKFEMARRYLVDRKSASFIFVLNAEKLSISETERALSLLRKHAISVDGIIVNRIIPSRDDEFLRKRKAVQDKCLEEIRAKFKGLILGYIPLLESDIQSTEDLQKVSGMFTNLFA